MSDETNDPMPTMAAGWYDDPTAIGEARYWDGVGWTTSVSTAGVTSTAAIAPASVGIPPVRGTEFRAPRARAAAAPQPVTVTQSSQRSPLGAILATVVALAVIVALVVLLTYNDDDDSPTRNPDTPITLPAVIDPPGTDAPPAPAGS